MIYHVGITWTHFGVMCEITCGMKIVFISQWKENINNNSVLVNRWSHMWVKKKSCGNFYWVPLKICQIYILKVCRQGVVSCWNSMNFFLSHVVISLWTKTGLLLDITFQWLINRLFSQQGNYHMTQKWVHVSIFNEYLLKMCKIYIS